MARKKHDLANLTPDSPWTADVEPAPGELRIVQALVNSADPQTGNDELTDPRALAAWLTRWGLLDADAALTTDDLERMIAVRAGLKALMRPNGSGSAHADALAGLDEVASQALLRVHFTVKGASTVTPAHGGLEGALARLFWIVVGARLEGRWPRLKFCAAKTCRRVFYDGSSTRSRRWCNARCGNRLAARRMRRRKPRSSW